MNHVRIRRQSKSVPVTVTTSVTASTSLSGSGMSGGIIMVSGVTASATLTLYGSIDGTTFVPLFGSDGAAATLVMPADGSMVALPDAAFGVRTLKLVSDADLGSSASVVVTLKT